MKIKISVREKYRDLADGDMIKIIDPIVENGNFLAIKRIGDRLDLVDLNCSNTGADISEWTEKKLDDEIKNWKKCVEWDEE